MLRFVWIIPTLLLTGFIPASKPVISPLATAGSLLYAPIPDRVETVDDSETLFEPRVYREGWHNLSQPKFWTSVLRLSPDSCVASIADTRQIVGMFPTTQYEPLTAEQKEIFKDSLKRAHGLPAETRMYITFGRKHYYLLREALPSIRTAIPVFRTNEVDPWYAQAILLIESPGMNHRSHVGAYGGFQLMKSVAVKYGLTVNSTLDERGDIARSAHAASKFIGQVCIPEARRMLATYGIYPNEKDMWFRFLVMHVYHAGPGNVRSALAVIQPQQGGMDLITTLWRTEVRGFKNASQNYTQIALACWMELDRILGRFPATAQPVLPVRPPASLPTPNLYKVD